MSDSVQIQPEGPFEATPRAELERQIMDSTGAKAEREWWAASEITALRADVERLRIENIQMQAALGYGILAEDERHILPTNPFRCGTCDASKHLRAEVERLRAALEKWDEANRLQHDYANRCRADLARKDKALLAALNDLTERLTESGELADSVTIAKIRAALTGQEKP